MKEKKPLGYIIKEKENGEEWKIRNNFYTSHEKVHEELSKLCESINDKVYSIVPVSLFVI